jgi:hypothetical protein
MSHDYRDIVEEEVLAGSAATPSHISELASDLLGP